LARILYITPFFNFPPRDGASLRAVNLFEKLSEKHDVELLTYNNKGLEYYNNQSNGKFKIHKLTSIHKKNIKLSFFQRLISSELPGFASHDINCIADDFEKLILESGTYDIYYFATQLMGQAVLKKKWPGIYAIDLYDIYSTYTKGKYLNVPFWRPFHWLFRIEALRVKSYEKKILRLFDHILVTSEEDMKIINYLLNKPSIHEVLTGINFPKELTRNVENGTILMVANFEYAGNNEGIKWFYKHVWQIILDKINNAKLVLVGKCPLEIQTMTKKEDNITITGIVPNLTGFYEKAACVILPLFHDGGTKTKLLEAMAYRTPIVSTKEAAKGIKNMNSIIIANDPKTFASSVTSILTNGIDDADLDQSRQLIQNHYTWDKIGDKLNHLIYKMAKARMNK